LQDFAGLTIDYDDNPPYESQLMINNLPEKLRVTPAYFGTMSKIVLFVLAMIKGDMVISSESCLSFDGHQ
jgi:hypothetical protein